MTSSTAWRHTMVVAQWGQPTRWASNRVRSYFEQLRITIAATGRVEPEELAPEVRRELVSLYRRWLAD